MTLFGRLVSQYFQKWKQGAATKAVKLDNDFKVRLIKLYRQKLAQAFNLWRVNRSAMVIEMQTIEFEDIQATNRKIEEVCREADAQIKQVDRSSRGIGAKHIKKLVTAAYQRNMKAYLDRWRKKNSQMQA